jgi:hypothetical protein
VPPERAGSGWVRHLAALLVVVLIDDLPATALVGKRCRVFAGEDPLSVSASPHDASEYGITVSESCLPSPDQIEVEPPAVTSVAPEPNASSLQSIEVNCTTGIPAC